MRIAWIAVALPLSLSLVGCGPDAEDDVYCPGGCGSGGDGFDSGDATLGPQPMLVRVQPGKTLTAVPGGGVGVFVEYATGGHWTIWWTCDTNQTGRKCSFDIDATTRSGDITNIAGFDGTELTPPDGGAPDAGSPAFPISGITTNQIQGVTFDAKPGAIVEVTASLDGQDDGSLFYFVDGNKVKDGYKGKLTDPLDFQPTDP